MFFLEKCVCVFKFVYIDQVHMPRRKNSLIFRNSLGWERELGVNQGHKVCSALTSAYVGVIMLHFY